MRKSAIVDHTLGVLGSIKEFVDESIFHHEHEGNDGSVYSCENPVCDIWVWNDPEIMRLIPKKFRRWINRDLRKLQIALLFTIAVNVLTLTGATIKIPGAKGRRIQLLKIIGWFLAIFSLLGVGAIITDGVQPIIDLLKVFL